MARDRQELLHVATIGKPNGVRGALNVRVFLSDPSDIGKYGPLLDSGGRAFSLKLLRAKDEAVVATISGVTDRSGAEELRGRELFLPRDRLPPPEEDEFYHADLIGMEARYRDGEVLGRVLAVHNFGAGDLLEIKLAAGRTVFVPFSKAAVPEIRLAEDVLVVDVPQSYLDDSAREEGE